MKKNILRSLAVFLIIEIGLTHYFSADHAYEESWIEGYLFIANFLGALVAAYGIYRRKSWGWILGTSVAVGSMIGYIWSRTTGLPGLPAEDWFDDVWGTSAMVVESLFCLLVLLRFLWRNQLNTTPIQLASNWRYLFSGVGLLALVLINIQFFQWDALLPADDHAHVFFLWQVKLQPEISQETLEEKYGMQVSLAAVSAMDSAVDVRMKILDYEKAEPLIEEGHFALLVGDTLLPAPHVHRHTLMNRTVIVLFPNKKNIVQSGTPVSLVFENLKVEPVVAQ